MKALELRKEQNGNYTVFQNPNPVLKQEISEFVHLSETVNMGWPPETWRIVETVDDEYKCISEKNGKDTKYFKISDINERQQKELEINRNNKFQAYNYFTDCFGIISKYQEYKERPYHLSILNITSAISTASIVGIDRPLDTMGVDFYRHEFVYSFETYNCLGIKVDIRGTSMCLYFTPEGDFINRDYNVDLSNYERKIVSPSIMLDELKFQIYKITKDKKIEFKAGKFYTSDYCFIPYNNMDNEDECKDLEFGIQVIPVRSDKTSYQIDPGYKIHKKPAKVDESSIDVLWETVFNSIKSVQTCLFSEDFLNYAEVAKLITVEN